MPAAQATRFLVTFGARPKSDSPATPAKQPRPLRTITTASPRVPPELTLTPLAHIFL
ncbi:hypothetical protein CBM2606_A90593 [Cupriavidus taiwanensis]|nr:hypothetical protein CBM2606_A90593 [Cupriavidus taiwanensis]